MTLVWPGILLVFPPFGSRSNFNFKWAKKSNSWNKIMRSEQKITHFHWWVTFCKLLPTSCFTCRWWMITAPWVSMADKYKENRGEPLLGTSGSFWHCTYWMISFLINIIEHIEIILQCSKKNKLAIKLLTYRVRFMLSVRAWRRSFLEPLPWSLSCSWAASHMMQNFPPRRWKWEKYVSDTWLNNVNVIMLVITLRRSVS